MSTEIDQLLDIRMSTIEALAKSVNLFLVVENHALLGNAQLASFVKFIEERIPQSHEASPDSSPLQSFYIGQNFVILISEFEGFLVDVMKWVLRKYPLKLGSV